jgi:predicted exporter
VAVPAPLASALENLPGRLRRLRWLPPVAAAVVVAWTMSLAKPLWEPSLSALSPVSAASQALDTTLRSDLGAPDMRYVVAVTAADADQALAGAGAAADLLQPLVERGTLAGVDSPSRLLPDRETQRRRRDALPAPDALQAAVAEATVGTALRAVRLAPFIADVEQARGLRPLGVADVSGTALGLSVDSMLVTTDGRSTAILPLRAAATGTAAAGSGAGVGAGTGAGSGIAAAGADGGLDAAAVESALAGYRGPGEVHLVDIKRETDSLYAGYLDEAIVLATSGVGLIVLVMAAGTRFAPVRLYRVVMPLAAALSCVIAALAAAGVGLTILHLVGLLLTVAVGSNYTFFFIDDGDGSGRADGRGDPQMLASLVLANATTITGFGILAFAEAPVLKAIGQTVGPGAFLCLCFAAMLSARPAVGGAGRGAWRGAGRVSATTTAGRAP